MATIGERPGGSGRGVGEHDAEPLHRRARLACSHVAPRKIAWPILLIGLLVGAPEAGHARDIGALGGSGGGAFRIACEPGDPVVGFDIWATHVVQMIAPICGSTRRGGTYGMPTAGQRIGQRQHVVCPPGGVLTILHVFADRTPLVSGVGFTCWTARNATNSNHPPRSVGHATRNKRFICPPGEMATGIYGRAGTAIDKLGLTCGPIAAAAPSAAPPPAAASVPPEWADMLAAHNERRRLHCVPPLTWSPQLAAQAQQWANQCTNTHNPGPGQGENLAFFWPPGQSDRFAFQNSWYCEVAHYNFDRPALVGGFKNACDPPVNGHFTQVVWRASQQLGCAKATCNIGGAQGTYWVCRYSPGGNDPNALAQNVLRPTCDPAARRYRGR